MIPDRSLPPRVSPLLPTLQNDDDLPAVFNGLKFNTIQIGNQLPLIIVNDPSTELIRVEVISEAGIEDQWIPLQAQMCSWLLKEGSDKMTDSQLAEHLDYYGAFTGSGALANFTTINLVVLKRYFEKVLPAFARMISHPSFSERPFSRIMEEKRQEFVINLGKIGWEARRRLINKLFGEQHPYGRLVTESDFKNLRAYHLNEFHSRHFFKPGLRLMITGRIDQHEVNILTDAFASMNEAIGDPTPATPHPIPTTTTGQWVISAKDSMQTAIRLGSLAPEMTHPDFIPLQIAVSALGGYFGSRLNMNLRETRGLTYGVGAALVPMKNHSVLSVGTEVEAEHTAEAVEAIELEMHKLAANPPCDEELQTLITYLSGSFLRSVDGSFALSERIRSVNDFGLDHRFYSRYLRALQTITPETIGRMASTYMNPATMTVVRVGK